MKRIVSACAAILLLCQIVYSADSLPVNWRISIEPEAEILLVDESGEPDSIKEGSDIPMSYYAPSDYGKADVYVKWRIKSTGDLEVFAKPVGKLTDGTNTIDWGVQVGERVVFVSENSEYGIMVYHHSGLNSLISSNMNGTIDTWGHLVLRTEALSLRTDLADGSYKANLIIGIRSV